MTLTPLGVGLLLFTALFGLSLAAIYFLVAAPAARRARRRLLEGLQRAALAGEDAFQAPVRPVRKLPRATLRLPGSAALEQRLQQAGLQVPPELVQLLCVGAGVLGFLLALALREPLPLALLLGAGTASVPVLYVGMKRGRRLSRFEEQFPEAVDLLGRAVRAGHAFTTGFELIADEMPEPVAGEFRIVYDQQRLGLSLREALEQLGHRVPSADVMVFVSALQIQRETGGNLAEILDQLSRVIRERFKLHRQIRVFTAEGRMSLIVLTAVPFVTGVGMYVADRDYLMPLLVEPAGRRMLTAAVLMLVTGFIVIRRMTNMKV
jgi:tight adherence protein B